MTCCCIHNILLLYDGYDDWKESIGDDNVENAVDGVNDEDDLPRGTNECEDMSITWIML